MDHKHSFKLAGVSMEKVTDDMKNKHECERFIKLLRLLFVSGHVHVVDRFSQVAPLDNPSFWGWHTTEPKGDFIGWHFEKISSCSVKRLFLDKDLVFAKVQALAIQRGEPFLMPVAELLQQLGYRGFVIGVKYRENGKIDCTFTRKVAGVSRRVMIMYSNVLEEET